jgi:hypothetical protein
VTLILCRLTIKHSIFSTNFYSVFLLKKHLYCFLLPTSNLCIVSFYVFGDTHCFPLCVWCIIHTVSFCAPGEYALFHYVHLVNTLFHSVHLVNTHCFLLCIWIKRTTFGQYELSHWGLLDRSTALYFYKRLKTSLHKPRGN